MFYCVLCGKVLRWNSIMKVVISTIDSIRKRGLKHHQFKHFLEEIEVEFCGVLYYIEVRWLSRGNVLRRFFNLRAETEIFMNEENKSVPQLSDAEWSLDLAFLVDIKSLLNELNKKHQGKGKLIPDVFSDIKTFEIKLELMNKLLKIETWPIFLPIKAFLKHLEKKGLHGQRKNFQKVSYCFTTNSHHYSMIFTLIVTITN
jgi:hypothetical protein